MFQKLFKETSAGSFIPGGQKPLSRKERLFASLRILAISALSLVITICLGGRYLQGTPSAVRRPDDSVTESDPRKSRRKRRVFLGVQRQAIVQPPRALQMELPIVLAGSSWLVLLTRLVPGFARWGGARKPSKQPNGPFRRIRTKPGCGPGSTMSLPCARAGQATLRRRLRLTKGG